MSPPKPLDIFSPEGGCSEGLDAFRFFLNTQVSCTAGLNAPPLRTSHRRVISRLSLCERSPCSGWDEQPRTSGRTRVQGVAKQGIIGPEQPSKGIPSYLAASSGCRCALANQMASLGPGGLGFRLYPALAEKSQGIHSFGRCPFFWGHTCIQRKI